MNSRTENKSDVEFGEYLLRSSLISDDILQDSIEYSKKSGTSFAEALLQESELTGDDLYSEFAKFLNLPYSNLSSLHIHPDVLKRVPYKVAQHYNFMPIEVKGRRLRLACSYPMSIGIQDEIRVQLGLEVDQLISPQEGIDQALRSNYGMAAGTVDHIVSHEQVDESDSSFDTIRTADQMAGDNSVISLVNEIIIEALHKRATDIHFEPYRGKFRLRYRVDGVLHDAQLSPKARHLILPIISRIKIMSTLDIVEHRLPQDGRSLIDVEGDKLDLRVSSIPTPFGESIVIRVLRTEMTYQLGKLGLDDKRLVRLQELINEPNGIILLTGPTGSGKTTTLYACLNQIKSDSRKIISIEDPIEYEFPGITQIQVNTKVGLDFARGLRSVLRHDPDIMMVGEIRDLETAEIAIRAALTGHLMFSTLHTNDAASGVTRLLDIGVQPYLVSSSVKALIAQRLVRVLCQKCAVPTKHSTGRLLDASNGMLDSTMEIAAKDPVGCDACSGTGYFGRTALYEILELDDEIRKMVLQHTSSQAIKRHAMSVGMITLALDGWQKVAQGITTPEEILQVT